MSALASSGTASCTTMSASLEPAARLEHAKQLSEDGPLVRQRLMTPFERTTSTLASGSGSASAKPLAKLDVAQAEQPGVASGFVEHGRGHVDANDVALGADLPGREERVEAGARAEIEHLSPGCSAPRAKGLPTPANDSTAESGSAST